MSYVLIVEDDVNVAKAIADMVELLGWEAAIANGPRPALELLRERPPAVALLDLNMSGVDGLEVCRFMKRDPRTSSVEVVFVSAEDDPRTVEKAKLAGAIDYVVKPLEMDRLEAILERISGKKKA